MRVCVRMKSGARGEQLLTFLHLLSVAAGFAQIKKMSENISASTGCGKEIICLLKKIMMKNNIVMTQKS